MEPIFTDKQLNNMSREDLISLMKIVQEQTKKKDTEIQLLKEKQKELEFLNAMLSDRLTLAQRKQFGASSEKYAEGYEQMNLFNEAEASADAETEELFEEIRPSSYKCGLCMKVTLKTILPLSGQGLHPSKKIISSRKLLPLL